MIKSNKKYLSLSVIYLSLIIGFIFLIFKFGIPVAVGISSFLQQRKESPVTAELSESIVPEPQLMPLPEATNSANLKISGYSLPNQKVHIYLNDLDVLTLDVDSEGKFEDFISLSLGESEIYGVTVNSKDIKSSASKIWTVFYNNSPPYLEILEPANESTITGKQNKNIIFKGKTAETSKVYINDQRLVSASDGSFSYPAILNEGDNVFKIVCLDPAQNKTELQWTLHYQQ